ncbi:MAG: response regulator [Elusimicrobiota bacterium]
MDKKKALVIEDYEDLADHMADVLTEVGFEVAISHSGADGLAKAEALRPDLVVVDLMLPEVHGFDVCQRLRSGPLGKSVRILVVSAKRYDHDVRLALNVGADRYLKKPFTTEEFLSAVKALT